MSVFVLKIIACISMILDHIKYAIPATQNFITVYAGRIAFPLFAFLVAEGYSHTKNLKRYCLRLFIYGIISQIPFMFFRSLVAEGFKLNIMFTLLLGLIAITTFNKIENKYISIPIIVFIVFLGEILQVDYGWYGVATVLIMNIFKNDKAKLSISFFSLITIYYYIIGFIAPITLKTCMYFIFNYIVPIICICLYNGKLGKKAKHFFYIFYPAHMILFYFFSFI